MDSSRFIVFCLTPQSQRPHILTEVTRYYLNYAVKVNFNKTCQSHETPEKGTHCYGVAVGTLSSGQDMAVAILNQNRYDDLQETLT